MSPAYGECTRRAGPRHARIARPRKLGSWCASRTPPITTSSPGTSEHLFQLVRLGGLELVVPAVGWRLVGPPAQEDRGVAKTIALQMVVLHLAHPLDAQRLPGEILARAPAAVRARHARRFRCCSGPFTPRMVVH